MSKSFKEDLTGQCFGRLTVLEFVPTEDKRTYWRCRCDCGNICIVWGANLKKGATKSCGCNYKKHGLTYRRIYTIWASMKQRCLNPNNTHYKIYGGRGIGVCDEWKNDVAAFEKWALINGYDDNLTLDRIDVNGNYEPSNCRWISLREQQRNRQDNILVKYNKKLMCLKDASEESGIKWTTLFTRYKKGDRGEYLFRPTGKYDRK